MYRPFPVFHGESFPTWPAMLLVALVHLAALFAVFFMPTPAREFPVLSFSVTLMDISVSQNSVSSAASTASAPKQTANPKESLQPVAKPADIAARKPAKPAVTTPAKSRSRLSHNSQAQTAVIAPITPAQFDAAYLQNPKPSYPPLSRRLGEQGNVLLAVYVSENGAAADVRLKQSSGHARLDKAAIEAVSRWRFAAARQGERLIASWVNVPVRFVLE